MACWNSVVGIKVPISFTCSLFPFRLYRYGHGYEIFCVASSPDGKLLASACKVCICPSFSPQLTLV